MKITLFLTENELIILDYVIYRATTEGDPLKDTYELEIGDVEDGFDNYAALTSLAAKVARCGVGKVLEKRQKAYKVKNDEKE